MSESRRRKAVTEEIERQKVGEKKGNSKERGKPYKTKKLKKKKLKDSKYRMNIYSCIQNRKRTPKSEGSHKEKI